MKYLQTFDPYWFTRYYDLNLDKFSVSMVDKLHRQLNVKLSEKLSNRLFTTMGLPIYTALNRNL